jgi:chromosome segregation ATPase
MTDEEMDARFASLREFIHERFRRTDERLDRALADLGDLKQRVTAVEQQAVAVRRDIVTVEEAVARQGARLDRIDSRLDRIERRLDQIVEPS